MVDEVKIPEPVLVEDETDNEIESTDDTDEDEGTQEDVEGDDE